MNIKVPILVVALLISLPTALRASGSCSLPQSAQGGGSQVSSLKFSGRISVGLVAGFARGASGTLGVGLQFASQGGYSCFMSTDAPIGVAALQGTASVQRLIPSAARTMTLEWIPSTNPLPVTYTVYTGPTPYTLSVYAAGITDTFVVLSNLQYMAPYYWQVVVTDQFGRTSSSPIYSFSIAPVQDHLIAAPNPFHPGHGSTTLMFNMSGAGSAELEIFSLPEGRRVFKKHLDGLSDGVNIYSYDGRDNGGRLLPNGVFTIRLIKHGASSAVETFKIISVR
jgi:hypothetical protein